jgi:DNA-binding response OmpR family regulator
MRGIEPIIIVTDDDDDDKGLIVEAFVENGVQKEKLVLASDGEELLKILPMYAALPCLVLLDLNMPRKDGRATLSEIKEDKNLKHIPVIIFTTLSSKDDILFTYKAGSNTYFTKPSNFQELVKVTGIIKAYWFDKAIIVK